MSLKQILVIGKNGQLAQSLQKISPEFPDVEFTFVGRDTLDLANSETIIQFFNQQKSIDIIINAAAYTAVDKAETDESTANQVNHVAVAQLAELAKQKRAFFIHVSTDYVFDGKNYKPYIESDSVAPQNVYGQTKLLGEVAMINASCQGAIVRTSWVYSEFGANFVKTMLRLSTERDSLGVIFDQIGSPTYAEDLAYALMKIAQKHIAEPRDGVHIYHYANEGVCSWYDFAKTIFDMAGRTCTVNPIESSAYPTPAARPHYSVMNKTKIKQDFAMTIPYWKESLKKCLMALKEYKG